MKSYEEFQQMFSKSAQGYLVTSWPFSSDSVVFYVNPAAESMLGIPGSELSGQPLFGGRLGSFQRGVR